MKYAHLTLCGVAAMGLVFPAHAMDVEMIVKLSADAGTYSNGFIFKNPGESSGTLMIGQNADDKLDKKILNYQGLTTYFYDPHYYESTYEIDFNNYSTDKSADSGICKITFAAVVNWNTQGPEIVNSTILGVPKNISNTSKIYDCTGSLAAGKVIDDSKQYDILYADISVTKKIQ